ncbi:uncharacterized protein LOC141666531 [Apium graveolens]|uniref:uncharacterized protein LOC141666531 n=1 Tax=Apium graveolens TaxID=4045 RepID=UPI003D7B3324
MDILGPFFVASGQRKSIVVGIDYFTKWIEAKALAKITTSIPRILLMNNGRQFDNTEFKEYCDDNSIELRFISVANPKANGQAEVANRIILNGLKKRVERSRNTWADDLLPLL